MAYKLQGGSIYEIKVNAGKKEMGAQMKENRKKRKDEEKPKQSKQRVQAQLKG